MKKILFEWKKIRRLKVYSIFLLLTLIFVSTLFFYNYISQGQIEVKKVEYFTSLRKDVSQQIQGVEEQLKRGSDTILEAQVEVGTNLSTSLQELISLIQSGDWQSELNTEIKIYETAIQYIKFDRAFFGVSEIDMVKIINLNKELLKRNLPKEDFDLSTQTSIFMKKVVSLAVNPIGFIMLLFVLGLIVTREFDDHTIRHVLTLPISRNHYMFIKFITIISGGLLWLALIFGSSYALGEVFGQSKGDIFNYPLYTHQDTFLGSGNYLIQAAVYSISFITFSIGLFLFIGYTIRNTIVTYSILLFVFAAGWLLTSYGIQLFLNPFTYQAVDQVILNTPQFYPNGIAVLFVALYLVLVATIMVKRKWGIMI